MFRHETSPFRSLTLVLVVVLAGCAMTNPSLNSFQATIQTSEWRYQSDRSGEFYEMEDECAPDQPKVEYAYVLIHGLYGDEDTFDRLQDELTFDPDLAMLRPSSVYLMEYWSSKIFPNFQSISELGRAFKKRVEALVECRKPQNLIIIAHSQGGLIAKEAILAWKEMDDNKSKEILKKTKLILIGTPNSFSTYAAYNNLIVNSIFAPITWATGIFTAWFGKAFVYNRQAFDMADNIFPEVDYSLFSYYGSFGSFRSQFMLNHIAKWGQHFPSGVTEKEVPKTYAIAGVKNLFNDYSFSDGVVHSDTLLLGGIPSNRVHHVPYRHFGGEAAVDDKDHHTFKAIKEIVLEKSRKVGDPPNRDVSEQNLSPYEDLPYSKVVFVMEDSHPTIRLESIRLETEKPPISGNERDSGSEKSQDESVSAIDIETYKRKFKQLKHRLSQDTSTDFLTIVGSVLAFPFQTLQALIYPVVNTAEERAQESEPSKWKIKHLPVEVLDGEHAGIITVRNNEKSWFFGMLGTKVGEVEYFVTDDPTDNPTDPTEDQKKREKSCTETYDIIWESSPNSNLPDRKKEPSALRLQRNAVNYIKIELLDDDKNIRLTREGCV